jgi:hypothetical protein
MSRRFLALIGAVAASLLAAPATNSWTPPRMPDGHPDLQGTWTNATNAPLERPQNLGAKEFYTEAEAAQREKEAAQPLGPRQTQAGTVADVHYDVSQFGLDRTQSKAGSSRRTSLIVGPEGRLPAMLPEAQKRNADRTAYNRAHQFDGPENRSLSERCILWPNEGPPMLPEGYNSNLQIVQGPGYVAIMQEMIHDVRIIPIDGRPHLPPSIRQWMGDSRGRWEGDTLVVDTTNFTAQTAYRGSSENLHVIERFTRTDADTVLYEFTVEDPATWAKPWKAELPMTKIAGPIFEYACSEGNYGLPNILSGARSEEKKAK